MPIRSPLLLALPLLALPLLAPPCTAQTEPAGMKPYTETVAGTPVEIPMVAIPAGEDGFPATFRMGSPTSESGRKDDEAPTVEVRIEPFWIGKCEITWDTFDAFRTEYAQRVGASLRRNDADVDAWVDAVSMPTPLYEQDAAPILTGLGTAGGYPVANITQIAARQFTKWLSKKTGHFYRLPTEAEWEYAARAGTTTAWSFGDEAEKLDAHAWFFDNSAYEDLSKGHPDYGAGYRQVGLKAPNPWGLHDVYGNVAEWVIDQYLPDAYASLGDGTIAWRDAIRWPERAFPCVVRGGSWDSDAAGCRSAARMPSDRHWQHRDPQLPKSVWWFTDGFHVGFRVLRPLVEPDEDEQLRFWEPSDDATIEILAEGGKQVRAPVQPATGDGAGK
jgi:formylglycine-generating enzyme required for sulfatase activity